jgi:hypothetical protein
VNNQKFVQMPLYKLKNRLKELCDFPGIRFVETEEAYTSKASFLDGDSLPKYGEVRTLFIRLFMSAPDVHRLLYELVAKNLGKLKIKKRMLNF